MMTQLQFVQTELLKIMNKYDWQPVDPNPRVVRTVCSNGINCTDQDCECNGDGVVELRPTWTNAESVWKLQLYNHTVLLMVFPKLFDADAPWFSLTVYEGTELRCGDRLTITNKQVASACSSSWYEGQRAGSAIPNPNKLQGPMYRMGKPDHFDRPEDVVAFLFASL